jgi:hypothetical protein
MEKIRKTEATDNEEEALIQDQQLKLTCPKS